MIYPQKSSSKTKTIIICLLIIALFFALYFFYLWNKKNNANQSQTHPTSNSVNELTIKDQKSFTSTGITDNNSKNTERELEILPLDSSLSKASSTISSNETQVNKSNKADKPKKSLSVKYDMNKLPSSNTDNHPLTTPITINNSYNPKSQLVALSDKSPDNAVNKEVNKEQLSVSTKANVKDKLSKAPITDGVTVKADIVTEPAVKIDTTGKSKATKASNASAEVNDKADVIVKADIVTKSEVKVDTTGKSKATQASPALTKVNAKADVTVKADRVTETAVKANTTGKSKATKSPTQEAHLLDIDLPKPQQTQIPRKNVRATPLKTNADVEKNQLDIINRQISESVRSIKDKNNRKISEDRQREYQAYMERNRLAMQKQENFINAQNVKSQNYQRPTISKGVSSEAISSQDVSLESMPSNITPLPTAQTTDSKTKALQVNNASQIKSTENEKSQPIPFSSQGSQPSSKKNSERETKPIPQQSNPDTTLAETFGYGGK